MTLNMEDATLLAEITNKNVRVIRDSDGFTIRYNADKLSDGLLDLFRRFRPQVIEALDRKLALKEIAVLLRRMRNVAWNYQLDQYLHGEDGLRFELQEWLDQEEQMNFTVREFIEHFDAVEIDPETREPVR